MTDSEQLVRRALPDWIKEEEADLAPLLIELLTVRRRGYSGLRSNGAGLSRSIGLATNMYPDVHPHNYPALIRKLLCEGVSNLLTESDDREAIEPYFGLGKNDEKKTSSPRDRRTQVARDIFHQSLTAFRDFRGEERAFLSRLSAALRRLEENYIHRSSKRVEDLEGEEDYNLVGMSYSDNNALVLNAMARDTYPQKPIFLFHQFPLTYTADELTQFEELYSIALATVHRPHAFRNCNLLIRTLGGLTARRLTEASLIRLLKNCFDDLVQEALEKSSPQDNFSSYEPIISAGILLGIITEPPLTSKAYKFPSPEDLVSDWPTRLGAAVNWKQQMAGDVTRPGYLMMWSMTDSFVEFRKALVAKITELSPIDRSQLSDRFPSDNMRASKAVVLKGIRRDLRRLASIEGGVRAITDPLQLGPGLRLLWNISVEDVIPVVPLLQGRIIYEMRKTIEFLPNELDRRAAALLFAPVIKRSEPHSSLVERYAAMPVGTNSMTDKRAKIQRAREIYRQLAECAISDEMASLYRS